MSDQLPVPIFGIAGFSKSGKTSLITDLIKALGVKNYSVATAKNSNKEISLDTEGKDTWKHKNAGAVLTVFNTAIESSILFKEPQEPEKLIEIIMVAANPDVILVEGCKQAGIPKIWVESAGDEECMDEKKNAVFTYTGEFDKAIEFITREIELKKITSQLSEQDCGKCGFETCRELAEQILDGKKELASCNEQQEGSHVELISAGEPVKLNRFAANIIKGALVGLAKELKGVKDPENIEIKLKPI